MRGCARAILFFSLCSTSAYPDFFPPAHELFRPLRADPREAQYALRGVAPVSHKSSGEAAIGDSLGVYRWNRGTHRVQAGVGGSVFGRFSLSARSNDMQVADFYGFLPIDFRWSDRMALRFMVYHVSSHLGDDYLAARGGTTQKHAWDNLRWMISYEPMPAWRVYGGYTYVFRTLPHHLERSAFQGGVEWQSAWRWSGRARFYWANDFQSWQRADWNPQLASQAGITLSRNSQEARAISIFAEFMAGRQYYGQFFRRQETRWNLGLKFHLT